MTRNSSHKISQMNTNYQSKIVACKKFESFFSELHFDESISLAVDNCNKKLLRESVTSTCNSFYAQGFDPTEAMLLYASYLSIRGVDIVVYLCEKERHHTVKSFMKLLPFDFDLKVETKESFFGTATNPNDNELLILSEYSNCSYGDHTNYLNVILRGLPDEKSEHVVMSIKRTENFLPHEIHLGKIKLNHRKLREIGDNETVAVTSLVGAKNFNQYKWISREVLSPSNFVASCANGFKVTVTYCNEKSVKILTKMDAIIFSGSFNVKICLTHLLKFNPNIKIVTNSGL